MELQNYNQDIISTSSSDIPQNYPNINNPPIPDNKYTEGQFQTQQQYNPPPSQQQYYQSQNIGYSSYPQNKSIIPILPENQYPPQNYVQPIPPVFQPPLDAEQNISQVDRKRITQPHKNMFIILRKSDVIPSIIVLIIGILMSLTVGIFAFIAMDGIMPKIISIIIFSASFTCLMITIFYNVNYKAEIILGVYTLTVVKKALCCRKKVENYPKDDLFRVEYTHSTTKRRVRRGKRGTRIATFNIFELFFIFKNGHKEKILYDEAESKIYTFAEIQFLVYYINSYINNQIKF